MILVTGGTGLVGSHLLFSLLKQGKSVRAIYRKTPSIERVKTVFSYYSDTSEAYFKKIEWVCADIREIPELNEAFQGITQVYHAAAFISFNSKHYSTLKKINVEGTANVVNLCLHHGVDKICYVSSIATLGNEPNGQEISEKTEFNPDEKSNVYSLTKYYAEMEVWRASQEGLEAVIVCPGLIFGAGFPKEVKNSNNRILNNVAKGTNYYTPGGTGFVDVEDVVKAMIALMDSGNYNQKYILVSKNISYKELLTGLSKRLQKKPPEKEISRNFLTLLSNLDRLSNVLFRTKRKLLKSMIPSLFTISRYSSEKIKKEIDFSFIDWEETSQKITRYYKEGPKA